MRTIQISTDVYAAIWSARKVGENSEDAVLRRVLDVKAAPVQPKAERDLAVVVGYADPKFGVILEPGFTVYRKFKGKEYTAQALQGFWISSYDQRGYPSLNELSRSIGAGTENAWNAWFYDDRETGKRRPVADKRDPNKIVKRKEPAVTLEDLGL